MGEVGIMVIFGRMAICRQRPRQGEALRTAHNFSATNSSRFGGLLMFEVGVVVEVVDEPFVNQEREGREDFVFRE